MQHDILWNELTPYEHLELFSVLKHVSADKRHTHIIEILDSVRLTRVKDRPVGTVSYYSSYNYTYTWFISIIGLGLPFFFCFCHTLYHVLCRCS